MAANKTLTPREREMAQLVAQGRSNAQVGATMGITLNAVKAHMGNIFSKLQINSRLQLALMVTAKDEAVQ